MRASRSKFEKFSAADAASVPLDEFSVSSSLIGALKRELSGQSQIDDPGPLECSSR